MSAKNLLIFGAAGKTGRALLRQGLDQGYTLTAFVRDPAKLELSHTNLQAVEGDIQDAASVENAVQSQPFDAAISALGTYIKEPITPIADGTQNIIDALSKHGPKRFIVVSSLGAGDSKGEGNWFVSYVQKRFLKHVLNDKDWQERHLIKSTLDWTIIRPPQLTDEPDIHEDRMTWVGPLASDKRALWKVSRADVAAECLKLAGSRDHIREALTLARANP